MAIFGSKTRQLEADIEGYLDLVSKSGLVFKEGVTAYLHSNMEHFEKYYQDITALESEADEVRRNIKYKLYTYMLIPESRGDVLGLLETLDDVVDICEKVIEQFSIEKPDIREFLLADFEKLTEMSAVTVDEIVKAARAFFHDITMVTNYVNKVHFYEHEVDDLEEQLKRKAFNCLEIERFSQKVHMRYFIEKIAKVSDVAQDVAERLSVYAIKRKI